MIDEAAALTMALSAVNAPWLGNMWLGNTRGRHGERLVTCCMARFPPPLLRPLLIPRLCVVTLVPSTCLHAHGASFLSGECGSAA